MTTQGRTSDALRLAPGYEQIQPLANYAPWLTDEEFQTVYTAVEGHTLVDVYRCYSLWRLVEQALQHPGDLLEVGVWRGGTGALIGAQAGAEKGDAGHLGGGPSHRKQGGGSRCVFLADTVAGVANCSPSGSMS